MGRLDLQGWSNLGALGSLSLSPEHVTCPPEGRPFLESVPPNVREALMWNLTHSSANRFVDPCPRLSRKGYDTLYLALAGVAGGVALITLLFAAALGVQVFVHRSVCKDPG